jgi:hypothetical protein
MATNENEADVSVSVNANKTGTGKDAVILLVTLLLCWSACAVHYDVGE